MARNDRRRLVIKEIAAPTARNDRRRLVIKEIATPTARNDKVLCHCEE